MNAILRAKALRGELSPKELQQLILELNELPPRERTMLNNAIRFYQTKYEQIYKLLQDDSMKAALAPIADGLRNDLKALGKDIVGAIYEAEKNNLSIDDVAKSLIKLFDVARQHATTLVNTSRLGMSRFQTIEAAVKSGFEKFQLFGPEVGIRTFCFEHLNKIYTIDEIRQMNNGQGLPVEYYCGGYNCRHRWIAVVK